MRLSRQEAAESAAQLQADTACTGEQSRTPEQQARRKRDRDASIARAVRPALHGHGSADAMRENVYAASASVILALAMRLASLVEGTPAYAQCIELIKKDIEDFAMTTPKDAARIVANYPRPR
jgi:hypothetical protein